MRRALRKINTRSMKRVWMAVLALAMAAALAAPSTVMAESSIIGGGITELGQISIETPGDDELPANIVSDADALSRTPEQNQAGQPQIAPYESNTTTDGPAKAGAMGVGVQATGKVYTVGTGMYYATPAKALADTGKEGAGHWVMELHESFTLDGNALQIPAGEDVTIISAEDADEPYVIDANMKSRVIEMKGADSSLTLGDVRITGGKAPNERLGAWSYVGNGGGVYVNAASAKLVVNTGAAISGNEASSGGGGGVSFNSTGGELTMNGGTISGNAAIFGGGVFLVGGIFTMEDGAISGNTTYIETVIVGYGGGVCVLAGTFTMKGGTISGNIASAKKNEINIVTAYGGGVFVGTSNVISILLPTPTEATFNFEGGTISDNTAPYGGGVYVEESDSHSADFNMTGGKVTHNTGGVTLSGGSSFNMSGNSEISNNVDSSDDAILPIVFGVSVGEGSAFNMKDGTISGNGVASGGLLALGGGVMTAGEFTMEGGTISGNAVTGDATYVLGGGVSVVGGEFTMKGGTVSGNTARDGGGVSLGFDLLAPGSENTFTFEGGAISGNTADHGGGVYAEGQGSHIDMTGGEVTHSTGGGIMLSGGAILDMGGDSKVSHNRSDGDGGGVMLTSGSALNMGGDSEISYNGSGGDGGGVMLSSGSALNMGGDSEISHNGSSGDGGGVYIGEDSTLTMAGGAITDNTAARNGGGIYTDDYAKLDIPEAGSATFSGNIASTLYKLTESDKENHSLPAFVGEISAISFPELNEINDLVPGNPDVADILMANKASVFNNYDINYIGDDMTTSKIEYAGNGGTSGSAPADAKSPYYTGVKVTALGQGSLARTNHAFAGWNTQADGKGAAYAAGDTFRLTGDTTLYAQWAYDEPAVAPPQDEDEEIVAVDPGTGNPPPGNPPTGGAGTGYPPPGNPPMGDAGTGNPPADDAGTGNNPPADDAGAGNPSANDAGTSETSTAADANSAGAASYTTANVAGNTGADANGTDADDAGTTAYPTADATGNAGADENGTGANADETTGSVAASGSPLALLSGNGKVVSQDELRELARGAGIPLVGIGENGVPLIGIEGYASWSLMDLTIVLAGILFAVWHIFASMRRREQAGQIGPDVPEKSSQGRKLFILVSVAAIANAALFLLSQDFTAAPLVMLDAWSIPVAALFILECLSGRFAAKKAKAVANEGASGKIGDAANA